MVQPEEETSRKKLVVEELPGMKSERRERLKKPSISFHFILKQYGEKEGFKPSDEEMQLVKELAELKESSEQLPLDKTLRKLYRFMN